MSFIDAQTAEISRLRTALTAAETQVAVLEERVLSLSATKADWMRKGSESVLRDNRSGCCCKIDESDELVSLCGLHKGWADEQLAAAQKALAEARSVRELVRLLEGSAANTGTDWRWLTATALRGCPQWETATLDVARQRGGGNG